MEGKREREEMRQGEVEEKVGSGGEERREVKSVENGREEISRG